MSVVLIDTSVFCNIVPVPGRAQNRFDVVEELKVLIGNLATLLLPMAAVLETGNHIAHLASGHLRRKTAMNFCNEVENAINGIAPWTPTPFWEIEAMQLWLAEFPNAALSGKGMGDLSIIKEWEQQCALNQSRRVRIWSLDGHLNGYDREP
jgi:hypothetical protein